MLPLEIIAQADTLIQEAVQLTAPQKAPLIRYYIDGGAGYMSILTLFLIGIFVAAWKAPAWVRDIGCAAFIASVVFTLIAAYQIFGLVQQWSEMPFGVACGGIRCALIPLIYGLMIYLVSIIISLFQKPRI